MGYKKRQFVEGAHNEIGLSSYVFDMPTEQLQLSMQRLDAMMGEWNAKGIRLGYPMPSSPENSDLDTETDVPDSAWEAIITNLAIRVAPSFGKQVMMETKTTAKRAYNTLLSLATVPPEMQFPNTLPAGAGNKPWVYDDPFLPGPVEKLEAGPDGDLEFT